MLPTTALTSLMTGATPVETVLPNGPQPAETGEFEVILASSAAAATTPAATLLELTLDPDAAMTADTELPENGKDLPVAAEPANDAVPAVAILALLPLPAVAEGGAPPLQPALDRPQPPATPPVSQVAGQPLPRLAPGKAADAPAPPAPLPQVPPMAATALPPVTLQRDGPRQAPPPRVAATLRLLAEAVPDKAAVAASDLGLVSTPATQSPSLPFVSVPVAAPTNAPVTAPTAIQTPHDFAQLIDRLVAARESTQPQAATLALAHAEFGQVELRFANDGGSLSVALASADPDFARAVQAAVPPVAASSDSASTQGRQQGQPGPQAESFAGQNHGQHTGRRASEEREPRANPPARSTGQSDSQSDIFA